MAGSYAMSNWSDLPTDLLLIILQRLQLRESLAFASVCASWRGAAAAAGVPSSCRTWLMSWTHLVEEESQPKINCSLTMTCKLRHLLDVNKSYDVDFPKDCFVACAGASHGWLVLVNHLSNLLLFNPITSDMVPLPPINDFSFVEAVYDEQGNIEGYRLFNYRFYDARYLATWFYQKAVLSCAPSKDGDCIAMIIHYDSNWLSFARAGKTKWQVASTLSIKEHDRYADCAYHNGRFYSVTYLGIVEKYHLDGPNGPTKEAIIAHRTFSCVLTRHLVSTPWGDLLQVQAISANRVDRVRFLIGKVHPEGCKKISPDDLMDHAIFVGLNHSACLPSKKFPGLRPQCIYFSAPWMTETFDLVGRCHGWGIVRSHDMETRVFENAFPVEGIPKGWRVHVPSEVWITPNM
ncbi:hypothetical protein CFC21_086650 [Triticum aestivum]|uniref:F-box domain-containing protein n=2 Tax=Triticum aestivum TaxID=4565 RepID=A0A3B6PGH5_WHEAT|nr:hypothetical protein CFC21_086650 [Triticum aestivum]